MCSLMFLFLVNGFVKTNNRTEKYDTVVRWGEVCLERLKLSMSPYPAVYLWGFSRLLENKNI